MEKFMKNLTIRLGIIIFVCAVLTACENFLEEQPNAVLTEANFYKTESDAKSAIDALTHQCKVEMMGGIMVIFIRLPMLTRMICLLIQE
jgi:hypothetical protein